MVGKISTGPSDSFIATNKIRVKTKRTSNTPWFMCLELQSELEQPICHNRSM